MGNAPFVVRPAAAADGADMRAEGVLRQGQVRSQPASTLAFHHRNDRLEISGPIQGVARRQPPLEVPSDRFQRFRAAEAHAAAIGGTEDRSGAR
jgi:hypothetical protein